MLWRKIEVQESALWILGEGAFQEEETADVKALGWKCA